MSSPVLSIEAVVLPSQTFPAENDARGIEDRDGAATSVVNAILHDDENTVRQLLQDERLLVFENAYSNNLLHIAVIRRKPKMVSLLLELGVPHESYQALWHSPLHFAVMEGDLELVRILVEAGSDVNRLSPHKATPLLLAIEYDRADILRYLVRKKARLNEASTAGGWTCLGLALLHGRDEIAEFMLARGATSDGEFEERGLSVLMVASFRGGRDLIQSLISHGAKLDAVDRHGLNCLHHAASMGNLSAAEALLTTDLDVNAVTGSGLTALDMASNLGHRTMMDFLSSRGARLGADVRPQTQKSTHEDDEVASATCITDVADVDQDHVAALTSAAILSGQPTGGIQIVAASAAEGSDAIARLERKEIFMPFYSGDMDPTGVFSREHCEKRILDLAFEADASRPSRNQAETTERWMLLRYLYVLTAKHQVFDTLAYQVDLARALAVEICEDESIRRVAAAPISVLFSYYLLMATSLLVEMPEGILEHSFRTANMPDLPEELRMCVCQHYLVQNSFLYHRCMVAPSAERTIAMMTQGCPIDGDLSSELLPHLFNPLSLLVQRCRTDSQPDSKELARKYLDKAADTLEHGLLADEYVRTYAELNIKLLEITCNPADIPRARTAVRKAKTTLETWIGLVGGLGAAIGHVSDDTQDLEHLRESNMYMQKALAVWFRRGHDEVSSDGETSLQSERDMETWATTARTTIEDRTLVGCANCDIRPRSSHDLDMCEACLLSSIQFADEQEDMLTAAELKELSMGFFAFYKALHVGKYLALATYFMRRMLRLPENSARDLGEVHRCMAYHRRTWADHRKRSKFLDDVVYHMEQALALDVWSEVEKLDMLLDISEDLLQRHKTICSKASTDVDTAMEYCHRAKNILQTHFSDERQVCTLVTELAVCSTRYLFLEMQEETKLRIAAIVEQLQTSSGLTASQSMFVSECKVTCLGHNVREMNTAIRNYANEWLKPTEWTWQQLKNLMHCVDGFLRLRDYQSARPCLERIVELMPRLGLGKMDTNDKRILHEGLSGLSDARGLIKLYLDRDINGAIDQAELVFQGPQPAKESALIEDAETSLSGQFVQSLSLSPEPSGPGFETSGLTAPEGLRLVANEALVTFFVGSETSEAIVIQAHGVRQVGLSRLKLKFVDHALSSLVGEGRLSRGGGQSRADRNSQLRRLLAHLWQAAVEPILETLGYMCEPSPTQLPRVYWVTRGRVRGLPFHAAGNFAAAGARFADDYVVSSYTLSVADFAAARRREETQICKSSLRAEAITYEGGVTNSHRALNLGEDITHFRRCFASAQVRQADSVASLGAFVKDVNVLHWASHGVLDGQDPARSGLVLAEKVDSRLVGSQTILSYFDIREWSVSNGVLANLCACSTASYTSQALAQEGWHIAQAFQEAGFRNVVATTWEVDHSAAVEVSKHFYEALKTNEGDAVLDDDRIGRALHMAVRLYRKRSPRSELDALSWTGFIHIGVGASRHPIE